MADSASESDSSSLDGGAMLPPSTVSRDQLQKRIESLQQQNRYVQYLNRYHLEDSCSITYAKRIDITLHF